MSAATAARFARIYSNPPRVIARPALFKKSTVSPPFGLTAIQDGSRWRFPAKAAAPAPAIGPNGPANP